MNSKLYNKEYEIPIHVIGKIQTALADHANAKNENGLKRAKFLLNNRTISYSELKRLKNFFDYPEKISSPQEYILAGGDEMKNWVNQILAHDRNSVKNVDKSRQTNDHALNKARLKIMHPQTLQPLRESAQDSNNVAAVAVLVDPEEKILLLKRSEKEEWEPGKWGLVGGMVQIGENPIEGARREIYEETNLKVERLIEKFSIKKGNIIEYVYYSIVSSDAKEEIAINDESDNFEFFTVDQIKELIQQQQTVPHLLDYISLVLFNELKD